MDELKVKTTKPRTERDRISMALRSWMVALHHYPGWNDWVREKISYVLEYDESGVSGNSGVPIRNEFVFPPELDREHALVLQYLGLQQTVETLKECEYYFRRYPFHGLPVTRASHITNICEMYFGRFYEFKERLKKYFEALKAVSPNHNLDFGRFIKLYEKIFDSELRARHGVHHHGRFEDLGINGVFLMETATIDGGSYAKMANRLTYHKLKKEWVERVRRRSKRMEEVLEAVARATLRSCRFLTLHLLMETLAECRGINRVRE